MKRKQIYIEEEQDKRLKEAAAWYRTSEGEFIRKAIDEHLARRGFAPRGEPKGKAPPFERIEDDPLWKIVGIVGDPDAPTDGSVNHDYYLYGAPRKVPLEE